MRGRTLSVTALLGILVLAACGRSAAPAVSTAASNAAAEVSGSPRWGMTAEQESAWEQVEAAADKEGTITYYGQGTIPQSQAQRFMDAWHKDYPNIKMDLVISGSPADILSRISTEQDAKSYVGDVADASVRNAFQWFDRGYTQAFIAPAGQDKSVQWLAQAVDDPDHKGTGQVEHTVYHPLWINSKLIPSGAEPKTHMDILDPQYKGKFLWFTPWTDGGGWNEYYYSKQIYGQDWVAKMLALDPAFSANTADAIRQVAQGEYAITLGPPGGAPAKQYMADGQPLKALWLEDFTYGSPSGHIFLNHSPHANAAKVFLNWWLTENGQRFWQSLGEWPIRADIPPAADWMKGFSASKQKFNAAEIPDQVALNTQKEAASYFKK